MDKTIALMDLLKQSIVDSFSELCLQDALSEEGKKLFMDLIRDYDEWMKTVHSCFPVKITTEFLGEQIRKF